MAQNINLRQVEAFKAFIEGGTVGRAADKLGITQPAISKMLAHLELDTGIELFDRYRGRLIPTKQAMRFYEEISRVFIGIRQIENAAEVIKREQQDHLTIGTMPGLDSFIRETVTKFLKIRPDTQIIIKISPSFHITDWLGGRQIDIGVFSGHLENVSFQDAIALREPLVCVMPADHELSKKREISILDLEGRPFISLGSEGPTHYLLEKVFAASGHHPDTVLEASTATAVCEFVAAGLGISLMHPLLAHGKANGVVARPFKPEIPYNIAISRPRDARNSNLAEAFITQARQSADAILLELLGTAA